MNFTGVRTKLLAAALLTVVVALTSCGGGATVAEELAIPDPTMVVKTVDGTLLNFTDVIEKDTVLWFWAPW